MGYTNAEIDKKSKKLVAKIKSIKNKDKYTQATSGSPNRYQVGVGGGDCSSTQQWVYQKTLGINIGGNTVAQYRDADLVDVNVRIVNGIPDTSKLQPGDLFYFAGTDTLRKANDYVGHVEMYTGANTLWGHGSGMGPFAKPMDDYCKSRLSRGVGSKKGLLKVRRAKVLVKKGKEPDVKKSAVHTYYPACSKKENSIVDALKSAGVKSDINSRKAIYSKNFSDKYTGKAEQNTAMLKQMKAGKLIKK